MEYVLSAQVVDGHVDLGSFRNDQVARREVIDLMERCRVVEDPSLAPNDSRGERESSFSTKGSGPGRTAQ